MDVLLIGSGGREHALAHKIKQSPQCGILWLAPGSDAMQGLGQRAPLDAEDDEAIVRYCAEKSIGLVVIGPEGPLARGLADKLRTAGIAVFGPGKAGAQLEASKEFSKQFMLRHGVATAQARSFDDRAGALAYALTRGFPVVVKADGLAAGKGVTVCEDRAMLDKALADIFEAKIFGAAGESALIEDYMAGEEASLLCFCDGKTLLPMASAQDHKRVGEGDTGPNTGGMGAYSPAPVLDAAMLAQVWKDVLDPTLAGLKKDGLDFRGCLYVGLMVTPQGPKVVEYNARFGDPETQVVLPRADFDLLDALLATAESRLSELAPLRWDPRPAVTVVLAAAGYPGPVQKGAVIHGLDDRGGAPGVTVYHAGTAKREGAFVSAGGRVLAVSALGSDLQGALKAAYGACATINFNGMHFRKDIAQRALARLG